MGPDPQADVVAFLSSGGLGCEVPTRIDTHAASIFLTRDRAWKLKRSVRFGYLDFSTAERRKAALEQELRLNRRTAPNLYIAIHAINRDTSGRLGIDGPGEPVDWLLEMRRFPDGALLSEAADKAALSMPVLLRLADQIQAFHASADIAQSDRGAAAFRSVLEGNNASMAAFPEILNRCQTEPLAAGLLALHTRLTPLLDERARSGHVRHGHGDLHLANIAMIEGEPVLFDCLEFNTELATVDVLYDLAFLLMDLWQRGYRLEANIVFNRYLDLSPADEAGIALLPLFLSARAAIRSHVLAAQSMRSGGEAKLTSRARAYLRLSADFIEPVSPRLIAVGGLSGAGKSTLARALGPSIGQAPGARILRSDVLRKRIAGLPPETRLPSARYSSAANLEVYRSLRDLAADDLAQGYAVIADAVFADPAERAAIEEVSGLAGVPFDGLWMVVSEKTRARRIAARPPDASDANVALVRAQALYDVGSLGRWRALPADGSLDDALAAARAMLGLA
jgi:hypothetical protein